jgi:glucan phosphoethanolaminetransferase (alkaline phosphatase superfamily)
MPRLIILIAVACIALILWHKIKNADGEKRKSLVMWSVIGSILGILAILAITGHLNVITAIIAGAVAMLPRLMQFAKYIPFINRLYQQNKQGQDQHQQQAQTPPPRGKQQMSNQEAMEVLGLKSGYSQEDIVQAHRRMMQKVHPDRGGSDYLAAQINKAKDTLLS